LRFVKTESAGIGSRPCHLATGLAGRFLKHCGFPVIYFVSNIFFLPAADVRPGGPCKTAG
jgi:hypothetical protein